MKKAYSRIILLKGQHFQYKFGAIYNKSELCQICQVSGALWADNKLQSSRERHSLKK